MKEDVASQIMAMSGAYSFLIDSLQIDPTKIESHFIIVKALSTIPDGSSALQFARSSEAYQIFINYNEHSANPVDLKAVFGNQLELLSSSRVNLSEIGLDRSFMKDINSGGEIGPCYDYTSDIYTQTPACNSIHGQRSFQPSPFTRYKEAMQGPSLGHRIAMQM